MAQKRFTRKTKGYNAQVFVAKAIDITTDATLALFIANAPLGEIGVYDGSNAIHSDAITSTEEFFFVMKTTEGIKRTPTYRKADLVSARKSAYVAPVDQVTCVGWNRTGYATNHETIAARQNFGLKIMETTEGYDPYPTWNFEYTTKTNDTILDVLINLAKKINDDNGAENKNNQRLVEARVVADATYGNYAFTGTTPTLLVTSGSPYAQIESGANDGAADIAVGDFLSISTAATPTDAIGDIYKVIAKAAGNDALVTLDRPFLGTTTTFTEAQAEGTRVKKVTVVVAGGIELTTIWDNVHFRVAVNENLINADITYVTAPVIGKGTYEQVAALEKEGRIYAGETTNNVAQAEKYGQQDTFTVVDETYDYYHFDISVLENGIAPKATYQGKPQIVIAVAKSAGNVDGTLETLFAIS
jgi:hypothetical protein